MPNDSHKTDPVLIKYQKNNSVVIEMPPENGEYHHTTENMASLMMAIVHSRFRHWIQSYVTELMADGSVCRKHLARYGIYNVNQLAVELPIAPGTSGKYGFQMNIVKPGLDNIANGISIQLFPVHDEIGFNLSGTLGAIKNLLPPWMAHSAQLVRNHGIDIPITLIKGKLPILEFDKLSYVEEWVVRPYELDFKYVNPKSPVQATVGLELGVHLRWNKNNPRYPLALASNIATNVVGGLLGAAAGCASGLIKTAPVAFVQGGAMVGQILGHVIQNYYFDLKPDLFIFWAGATLGAADVNGAPTKKAPIRTTEYPRVWGHVIDKSWSNVSSNVMDSVILTAIQTAQADAMERGEIKATHF